MTLMTMIYNSRRSVLRYISAAFIVFGWLGSVQGQKVSYREFFYPDGTISSKGYFSNGQPDGYWSNYHPNGKLKSFGKRTNNQLDSVWKFYDPHGLIISEINYLDGNKNGYYLTYEIIKTEDSIFSALKSKELYVQDQKQGRSFYYDFSGYISEEVPFVDGKKHGTAFYYDSSGNKKAYAIWNNGIQISYQLINKTDSLGNKTGIWKDFYPDGSVKSESVYSKNQLSGYTKKFNRNGQLIGAKLYQKDSLINDSVHALSFSDPVEQLKYFDNGQPRFRGMFVESIPIGTHRWYDSTGMVVKSIVYDSTGTKTAEGIFTDKGLKIGRWIYFYPNGLVYKSGNYKKNREHGTWKFYYPTGNLRETGNYLYGKYSGTWTFYHSNGSVLREIEYVDGSEDGLCIEYNDSSVVISEGIYMAGLREGLWNIRSGQLLMSGKYREGERIGQWKYLYPDNSLRFTGNYRLGRPHGKHKYYYYNSKIEREEIWKNGKKDKIWKYYRKNGTLEMMVFYRRGKERDILYIDEND